MADPAKLLIEWKKKIDASKQAKASLEGKLETLQERGKELRSAMEKDFGVKTLKELDKKIAQQEQKVQEKTTELETLLGESP